MLRCIIPTLGPKDPSGVLLVLYARPYVHPSVCLSVSLSSRPHQFLTIISAVRNCAQHMKLQDMG